MEVVVCFWCMLAVAALATNLVQSQDAKFWNDQAYDTLQKSLTREQNLNTNTAKNVVMIIGDGMGITTETSARILKGQLAGSTEEERLEWDKFSSAAIAKTYTTDKQVPDSAGTATAYFCGVKTKSNLIGVDDSTVLEDCASSLNADVESVMISAEKAGKATGFVTTTRVTHATPSCLYAHSPSRGWEADSDITDAEAIGLGCTDIAQQMIVLGKNTKVILGGGRKKFLPNTVADPEYSSVGERSDGRNLIEEWKADKDPTTGHYVWNLAEFNDVDPVTTEYLLGLFEPSHMKYSYEQPDDMAGEPTIEQMTEKAIQILSKDEDGFFLMVEGGRIDQGHHAGSAYISLTDAIAMDKAVAKVMEMTNENETLVIVTADHSHTLTVGGDAKRGNPILGKSSIDGVSNMDDGLPFTTLSYANGPGGEEETQSLKDTGQRRNLTEVNTEDATFIGPAFIARESESHGGEDVGIHANGPMSHLFHGVHEQNYIAHVVRYAARLDGQCGETSRAPSLDTHLLFVLVAAMYSSCR